MQSFVVFFTLYFALRDQEEFIDYIKSLLPFSKEVEKKLFDYSKGITSSVLYGQVIVGIVQGIIMGIGFFIFKVPNSMFLTFLTAFAGILPIIGPAIVWAPVVVYLLVAGNTFAAIGITVFGLISSTSENFLHPWIVSKRICINSSIILIGMVGGIFLFGLLGIILGPLILSYLLIVLEIYRNKKISGLIIHPEKNKS